MKLTPEQYDALLRPIKPVRVSQDNNGKSHVEAWEIAAHLTRLFGFGQWHKEILTLECIHERSEVTLPQRGQPGERDYKPARVGWWAVYRCTMRLHVGDWHTDDVATGDAQNQVSAGDAHDMAAKTAVSQALKRCAKDLGDQFGLSLYNGGSLVPAVGMTLMPRPIRKGPRPAEVPDVEAHAPAPAVVPTETEVREIEGDPRWDPETGEVLTDAEWAPFAEAIGVEPSDPQADLGGQVPPVSTPEGIAVARQALGEHPVMMYSSTRRSIHTAAKLLGHEAQAGHEYARAEGNRALGQPEDTSMETWTKEQSDVVLKHMNALVKASRS